MQGALHSSSYFRRKEIEDDFHQLLQYKKILILYGPSNVGKSTLIQKVVLSQPQYYIPIMINFRKLDLYTPVNACISILEQTTNSITSFQQKQQQQHGNSVLQTWKKPLERTFGVLKNLKKVQLGLKGFNIELRDTLSKDSSNPPQQLFTWYDVAKQFQESIEEIESALDETTIEQSKRPFLVLVMDEAHLLSQIQNKQDIYSLLNMFIALTKEEHATSIVFATSDSFFLKWLHEHVFLHPDQRIMFSIGDLSHQEAKQFWNPQNDQETLMFEKTYQIVGGHMLHLGLLQQYKSNPKFWQRQLEGFITDRKSYLDTIHLQTKQKIPNSIKDLIQSNTTTTPLLLQQDHLKQLMELFHTSPFKGIVPLQLLEQSFAQPILMSFFVHDILTLRFDNRFVEDIDPDRIVSLQYFPIATFDSPLTFYCMKLKHSLLPAITTTQQNSGETNITNTNNTTSWLSWFSKL